jgi:hypothetical protein
MNVKCYHFSRLTRPLNIYAIYNMLLKSLSHSISIPVQPARLSHLEERVAEDPAHLQPG